MKICFVLDYNIDENIGGGIINSIRGSIINLNKFDDVEVSFVSLDDKTYESKWKNANAFFLESISLSYDETGDGTGERIPNLNRRNIKKLDAFFKKNNFDIVIPHSEASTSGSIALRASRKFRIPLLVWLHVLPNKLKNFYRDSEIFNKLMYDLILKQAIKNYHKNVSALLLLNKSALEDIKAFDKKFVPKYFIFPNARDLSAYENTNIRKGFNSKNLTFLGHISNRKNQKYLVNVMKFLPEYTLNLYGHVFEESSVNEIENLIKDNKLTNVNLKGSVDHNEVPNILENTKVFVSASLTEVQSLVILESMAAGRPIVGLENETLVDLKDTDFTYVLRKNTQPEYFAKKIKEVLNYSEAEYTEVSQAAKQYSKYYSFENQCEILFKILSEVKNTYPKDNFKNRVSFLLTQTYMNVGFRVISLIQKLKN